jgi:hypothetical protein
LWSSAPVGTPTNAAVQKYLNAKKVPQLFAASGGSEFGDPAHFPWTIGWRANYRSEARIYAKYIRENATRTRASRCSIRTTTWAKII